MTWRGEIIGHRGAAGVAPENTLASFEAAIAAGAHRVEFDVRRTFDGRAVVFHDLTLDRFVPGARGRSVSRSTLDEMRAIDVGATLGRPGCFVPSLDDVLEALEGRVKLNVEVKGSGADGMLALPLAVEAVRRHGLAGDVVLSSFHAPVMRLAQAQAKDMERALIVDQRNREDVVALAASVGCAGLHPSRVVTTPLLVQRCREAGLALRCWTVDDPVEMARFMAMGVDGIVSDVPGLVREVAARA